MKTAVATWSYRQWFDEGRMDIPAFLEQVKDLGAAGAEIHPRHLRQDEPIGPQLEDAARRAAQLGLEIAAVTAGNNFALATAAERAGEIERFVRMIEDAAAAGIRRLNTFTGYHNAGTDPLLERCRVIDAYREVCPLAAERNILLCLENHSTVCRDADGMLAILAAVGSPALRTNPDPTNFVAEFMNRSDGAREAIYTETARIAPAAANAHFKVGDFTDDGEHAYVDTARMIDIYRRAGYEGFISLEIYGREHPAHPTEVCTKALALLERHLGTSS